MSRSFDLDPVDRITAGAVGEPGERVFFVQARAGADQVTLLAEKEQVRVLAAALEQLLDTLPGEEDVLEGDPDELALEEPLEPEWRAGSMSIEYDELADRIAIVIEEAVEEETNGEPATARFVATRAQARAMSVYAQAVVAAGRPRCQFCGEPIDVDGHVCPAMNGHRKPVE